MKKSIFLFLIIALPILADASHTLDSLGQILLTAQGSEKIDALNTLASIYLDTAFLLSIEYATQAQNLAILSGDKYREALALKFIGFGYSNNREYDKANTFFEQSLALQEELQTESEILIHLNLLGTTHKNMGNYSTAISSLIHAA